MPLWQYTCGLWLAANKPGASQEFNAIAKVKQLQQQREQQQGQLGGLAASGSNPLLQQLLQKRSRAVDGRDGDAEEDNELEGEEQPDAANTFLVRPSRSGFKYASWAIGHPPEACIASAAPCCRRDLGATATLQVPA